MSAPYIVSIVSFAFCLFIFFYLKWYIKRHSSADELLRDYRTEVYRLIADIDSVTDRDSQLVEERIKKLNSILDEAEKRIAVYVKELERSKTGEALYTSLGRGIRAALKTPAEEASTAAPARPASSPVLPQAAEPKLTIVKKPASAQAGQLPFEEVQSAAQASPPAEASVLRAPSKKQIRSEIEKLVNQGLSAADIASRLDLSLSEVDLAINLLSRQKK